MNWKVAALALLAFAPSLLCFRPIVPRETKRHAMTSPSSSPSIPDSAHHHRHARDCWPFDSNPPSTLSSQNSNGSSTYSYVVNLPNKKVRATHARRPGESMVEWQSDSLGMLLHSACPTSPSDDVVLCWYRFKIWWMQPAFLAKKNGCRILPPGTVALLWCSGDDKDQRQYRFVMTRSSCSLKTMPDGSIVVTGASSQQTSLYCATGADPYALIREGMLGEGVSHHHQPRQTKTTRTALSGLGWCTWNAFYTDISGPKLVEAVETLQQRKIPIRWMIIDDGWQHTTNDGAENGQQWFHRLAGWTESPSKFDTQSLRDTIAKIKHTGTITHVWVWHTLMGYWLGLDTESFPGSKIYYPHFPSAIVDNDPSAESEASVEKGVGIPDEPSSFYTKYHEYLKRCGVSGVKVDAQGIVETLRPFKWDDDLQGSTSSKENSLFVHLQRGLAESVRRHFGSDVIHCMAHVTENFSRLPELYPESLPFMRISDDHYPDNPNSQGPQIVACAFNSLLLSHISVPDWDMFTTSMPDKKMVRMHAVSRCLSGGPVYVSDSPLQVRRDVIDWMCCADGSSLICRNAALPIARCLLMDPLSVDSEPLVIFNTNGRPNAIATSGVLGVFDVAGSGRWDHTALDYVPIENEVTSTRPRVVSLRPNDIPDLCETHGGGKFLATSFFNSSHAVILEVPATELVLEMEPVGCEAVSIVPIVECDGSEMALLGFAGKINGAGSVLQVRQDVTKAVTVDIVGCGTFLVAIGRASLEQKRQAISVELNGSRIAHTWYTKGDSTHGSTIPGGVFQVGFDILAIDIPTCGFGVREQRLSLHVGS